VFARGARRVTGRPPLFRAVGVYFGADAYQRVSDIVKQGRPRRVRCFRARHKDIVDPRKTVLRQEGAGGRAKPPAGPVSDDGVADLGGGCEPKARWAVRRAAAGLDDNGGADGLLTVADEQELGAFGEPLDDQRLAARLLSAGAAS